MLAPATSRATALNRPTRYTSDAPPTRLGLRVYAGRVTRSERADPTRLGPSELAKAYRDGSLKPSGVLEAYLERLEPGPVYRVLTAERARRQAAAAERLFGAGVDTGPLQGVPVALKDLIDTEGEVSAAGSRVLLKSPSAPQDAPVAARLDAAGAVFLGRTGMTELAYSGLGLNPHFGTPPNALDDARVPGGSSSGSAVAVAAGLAPAAVGSDTGGSVRIPASFNGLVGLKPSEGALPMEGCVPLSSTLDTLGPIARSAEDAWLLWLGLAARPYRRLEPLGCALRLLAPTNLVLDDADPEVLAVFEAACEKLARLGHRLEEAELPELAAIPALYARYGPFHGHESYALYGELVRAEGAAMDPRVTGRILEFAGRPASDYLRLVYARAALVAAFWARYGAYDAIILPTVPVLPPTLASVQPDEAYVAANRRVLRNTSLFNFLAGPAASVPAGRAANGLSVGVMIASAPGEEELTLQIAAQLESAAPPG